MKGGSGSVWRAQSIFRPLASAVSYDSSGFSRRALCCSRSFPCSSLFSCANAARRSPLSRLDTTSTTRDASSTCTVVCPNSGAIFTAVCCRLVVAPPMSSGSRILRRSISFATNTISSSDGVMRPLSPTRSAFPSMAVCRILSDGTMTPRSTTS